MKSESHPLAGVDRANADGLTQVGCRSSRSRQILGSLVIAALLPTFTGQAASPPTITRIYAAPGQIQGGLSGDGSNLYFTTLAKNTGWTYSLVVSITSTGTERWTWNNDCPLAGGNMRMTPTINSAGTRLFIGADHGKVFCLDTATSPAQRKI